MPRCKNCVEGKPVSYYTGKENTPQGRGYCARYEKEGKKMMGKDGKMYRSNGKKWIKIVSKKRHNPRLYYTWEDTELPKGYPESGYIILYHDDQSTTVRFVKEINKHDLYIVDAVPFKQGNALLVLPLGSHPEYLPINDDWKNNKFFKVYDTIEAAKSDIKKYRLEDIMTDEDFTLYDYNNALKEQEINGQNYIEWAVW